MYLRNFQLGFTQSIFRNCQSSTYYSTLFIEFLDRTEGGIRVRISSRFSVLKPFSYLRPFLYFVKWSKQRGRSTEKVEDMKMVELMRSLESLRPFLYFGLHLNSKFTSTKTVFLPSRRVTNVQKSSKLVFWLIYRKCRTKIKFPIRPNINPQLRDFNTFSLGDKIWIFNNFCRLKLYQNQYNQKFLNRHFVNVILSIIFQTGMLYCRLEK